MNHSHLVEDILQQTLDDRKEKGLTETEHDRIYNAALEREIVIQKHLNFSHLNSIGKTIEEFEEYMEGKNIYVMSEALYNELRLSYDKLERVASILNE